MSEYIITTEQLNFFTSYMPDDAMIPAKMAHLQPLVRCRDCEGKEDCEAYRDYKNPHGFCAWGERMEP